VTPKTAQQDTLSTMFLGRWEQAGSKLATLAGEFPENAYENTPVEGIRTFGGVLRHIAFWNQFVVDTLRGKKADDTSNELPNAEYSTKARIVHALTRSTADVAEAIREHGAALEPKTAELVMSFIEHNCEHYGQLVVYARLNGIVPPASRAS